MLEAMRQLALDALWVELDDGKSPEPEAWYRDLRARELGRLFPKLVEDVEQEGGKDKQRYYTLQADPNRADVAVLKAWEFKDGDSAKLPFNQASGPQSPALGPVIKRTASSSAKEAGPSVKIQQSTLKAFGEIAAEGRPWSPYFGAARECFLRPNLLFNDQMQLAPGGAYQSAVNRIDEKRTVLVAFQDERGRLPGEVPEYVNYLQAVLARTKYATGKVPRRIDLFSVRRQVGGGLSERPPWRGDQPRQPRPRRCVPWPGPVGRVERVRPLRRLRRPALRLLPSRRRRLPGDHRGIYRPRNSRATDRRRGPSQIPQAVA
jgi:hypothetical protein